MYRITLTSMGKAYWYFSICCKLESSRESCVENWQRHPQHLQTQSHSHSQSQINPHPLPQQPHPKTQLQPHSQVWQPHSHQPQTPSKQGGRGGMVEGEEWCMVIKTFPHDNSTNSLPTADMTMFLLMPCHGWLISNILELINKNQWLTFVM